MLCSRTEHEVRQDYLYNPLARFQWPLPGRRRPEDSHRLRDTPERTNDAFVPDRRLPQASGIPRSSSCSCAGTELGVSHRGIQIGLSPAPAYHLCLIKPRDDAFIQRVPH